nr:hypothetical protein [uncultured Anaerostipes sp.]
MEQNQTSWENFFRNDSSNMLEDALPYLPPNLKKMAAIYIKLTELSKISTQFDDEQTLSACGFDQNPASMELLLNAMKLRAPKETAEQIEQILQMMQMFEIYQNYQRFVGTTSNHNSAASSNSDTDLFSKLMPMMMAGDPSSNNRPQPTADFMNKLNQILKK